MDGTPTYPALLTGGNIVNVERVEIVTNETTPVTYEFSTSSEATFTPAVSAGVEKEQRIKNTLMGLIKTEDINKGYDIELSDQRLVAEIFALLDGGENTFGGTGGAWSKYEGPAAGSPVTRKSFTLNLYTSDRGTDGEVITYHKWSFPNCKGAPVTVGAKDDDFYTIRYRIQSRPAAGSRPLTLTPEAALPTTAT